MPRERRSLVSAHQQSWWITSGFSFRLCHSTNCRAGVLSAPHQVQVSAHGVLSEPFKARDQILDLAKLIGTSSD